MPRQIVTIDLPGRLTVEVDATPTGAVVGDLQQVYAAIGRYDRGRERPARYGRPRRAAGWAEAERASEERAGRIRMLHSQREIERRRAAVESGYYATTGRVPAQPSALDQHNARTRARAAALACAAEVAALAEPAEPRPVDADDAYDAATPRQRRIEEWYAQHATLCDPTAPHAARLAAARALRALEAAHAHEQEAEGGTAAAWAWAWVPFDPDDRWGVFTSGQVTARVELAVERAVHGAAVEWVEANVQRALATPDIASLEPDARRGERLGLASLRGRLWELERAGERAAAMAWVDEVHLALWALDGIWPDRPAPESESEEPGASGTTPDGEPERDAPEGPAPTAAAVAVPVPASVPAAPVLAGVEHAARQRRRRLIGRPCERLRRAYARR